MERSPRVYRRYGFWFGLLLLGMIGIPRVYRRYGFWFGLLLLGMIGILGELKIFKESPPVPTLCQTLQSVAQQFLLESGHELPHASADNDTIYLLARVSNTQTEFPSLKISVVGDVGQPVPLYREEYDTLDIQSLGVITMDSICMELLVDESADTSLVNKLIFGLTFNPTPASSNSLEDDIADSIYSHGYYFVITNDFIRGGAPVGKDWLPY